MRKDNFLLLALFHSQKSATKREFALCSFTNELPWAIAFSLLCEKSDLERFTPTWVVQQPYLSICSCSWGTKSGGSSSRPVRPLWRFFLIWTQLKIALVFCTCKVTSLINLGGIFVNISCAEITNKELHLHLELIIKFLVEKPPQKSPKLKKNLAPPFSTCTFELECTLSAL